jgi:transposase-like protein
MRKKGTKNKVYDLEFKLNVVERMLKEKLSYRETIRLFDLGKQGCGGSFAMLQRWERAYLEEGVEGLMKERRGKNNPKAGRPPKLDKAVEEDLIAEVQRLRAENEYLKKLHALALSRIKSENETEPE